MTLPSPAALRTDMGGHPEHNEDSARTGERWWAVADGMGGHAGGEVASRAAVDAVARVLDAAAPGPREQAQEDLLAAFDAAAAAVRDQGRAAPGLESMGTTLVVALAATDGALVVGNVGDSRAYLLDDEGLHRLTRDDNLAEEMLSMGLLDAQQAATHPGQYQLTKVVAAYGTPPLPTLTLAPARGRLLLCSDGLTGELCDRTVASVLGAGDVDTAAEALLGAALRAPARDNVTLVVVDL